jgi:hypothetical protein
MHLTHNVGNEDRRHGVDKEASIAYVLSTPAAKIVRESIEMKNTVAAYQAVELLRDGACRTYDERVLVIVRKE